ncbi:MAG TPA: protein kinase [Pyrinomonadaceae bacterium]|nr:protein kinase [Pyrinomonadaceae bacterium]
MKHCPVCKTKFEEGVSFCPTDGEVLEEDPSSLVDTVLDGQYKIESLLGKGGMGAVYLARHILLGDRVAIKILPAEVRNNAEWLRRFRREGQAARRFRHPNAVTVYDLRTAADGTIYMVMEYVEGHTLDAELKKRGRFSPSEALKILNPIMSVLNTAHEMGVVHRDLKPENIMIGKEGGESSVKLLDLGIAKMREIAGAENTGATELTMAGQVLGTPYYMSPEQWGEIARDGNFEIDGRADIYSLGLVAYQMLTGKRAYSGGTLHELRREHLAVTPPPLREVVQSVPNAFSEAITRAISKDRNDRQHTAGQLAAELKRAVEEGGGAAVENATLVSVAPDVDSRDTSGIPAAVVTNSDVNAATIVTSEALPVRPLDGGAPAKPQPAGSSSAPAPQSPGAAPGVPASGDLASIVTIQQPPRAQPTKSRGKSFALIGAGALVLILAVVGLGGFLAVNWWRNRPDTDSNATNAGGSKGSTKPDGASATTLKEFGSYWLEVLPNGSISEPLRVAGSVPLKSGQAFKFHFKTQEDGYLYILGPGEGSKPTAFLTEKPASISGLDSNQVSKGSDFSFPSGLEHWLELDKKPGTEDYTVIFSPEPLTTPAFLRDEATGKPLSETERSEFNDFLSKYRSGEPVTELNNQDSAGPAVVVKVPQSREAGSPVIFDVRIQHK